MQKILALVVISIFLLAGCSGTPTSYESSSTYTVDTIAKGTPTGYSKVLGTGEYYVGVDIEPGTYNITDIDQDAYMRTDNLMSTINTAPVDGTLKDVVLFDGQYFNINDWFTNDPIAGSLPMTFTQIAPENVDAQDVSETLTYDIESDSYTCTSTLITDSISDCTTLHEYDKLLADIETQKTAD